MKRLILPAILMATLALTVACGKDHQCKCVPDDGDDTHLEILFVGPSVDCADIKETAYEERYTDSTGQHTLRRYEVHSVTCRDYHQHD